MTLKDILGYLVPPYWSLRPVRTYRGEPLAARLAGQRLLALNVCQNHITPLNIEFSRSGPLFSALPQQKTENFRVTPDILRTLKVVSRAKFVAASFGAGPEQDDVALITNSRRFSNDLGFHMSIAHNPEAIVTKPKLGAGICYRGIPHPELPQSLVALVSTAHDRAFVDAATAAGLSVVRSTLTLLQLVNIGLASTACADGASLLVVDNSQALFIPITARNAWDAPRFRRLKAGQEDLQKFVSSVVKTALKDPATAKLVLLDTRSSPGVDARAALAGFTISTFAIPGIEPELIPNLALTAA